MLSREQLKVLGISDTLYDSLNDTEKDAVNQVIDELSTGTSSNLYEQLFYSDYKEIPVSFEQFISDDNYLGKSTRQGQFIYPFWKKECSKIVLTDDVEVALSGAIGIGKTTIACLMMAYVLYRVMCMRDPQAFFNLSPGSTIVVAFLNNTLGSSYGVGYETFQSFLKDSPWFLKHGSLSGRNDPVYVPEAGFDIIVGSRVQHTLGRHVICLTGDTVIKTVDGNFKISDLENKITKVETYNQIDNKIEVSSNCIVKQTGTSKEIYEIELEDGSILKCTPDHQFLLKSGKYKCAKDLTEEDELVDIVD